MDETTFALRELKGVLVDYEGIDTNPDIEDAFAVYESPFPIHDIPLLEAVNGWPASKVCMCRHNFDLKCVYSRTILLFSLVLKRLTKPTKNLSRIFKLLPIGPTSGKWSLILI